MQGMAGERPALAPAAPLSPAGRPARPSKLSSRPAGRSAGRPSRRRGGGGGGGSAASAAAGSGEEALQASFESHTAESACLQPAAEVGGSGWLVKACWVFSPAQLARPSPAVNRCASTLQVEAHAFVAQPQPQALDTWLQLGPFDVGGAGPFPTSPIGAGSGWVVAAAVLLAGRMGRLTAQEARMDVRKLQVGGWAWAAWFTGVWWTGCGGGRAAAAVHLCCLLPPRAPTFMHACGCLTCWLPHLPCCMRVCLLA